MDVLVKNCPGPALAEDETPNASVPGSVVDIEENLVPSEAANDAVVTTDRDLLQSLVDSVDCLSNKVRKIRHETQDLHKLLCSSQLLWAILIKLRN